MQIREIKQLAKTSWSMRDYLKRPLNVNRAKEDIKIRMDNREENFLNLVNKSIYENQNSPYRKLLLWAGCDYKDLQDCVRSQGLEKTLEKLQDEGVYTTLEEFKSQVPISRKGLTIETSESDFSNPLVGAAFQCTTSGSRSSGTDVMYNLDCFAEEAADKLIYYETHGLLEAPLALWLPVLPCLSGIHNFLMNIKFRKPPDKWFSQLGTEIVEMSRRNRRVINNILLCSRFFGLSVPRPEFTDIGSAAKVAQWMETTRKTKGVSVVSTYVSSAIRIVQAAIDKGIDISGNVISASAEPLTPRRAGFIKSAGVKALPYYAATETGLIGASCGNGNYPDDMHICLDRFAIIQRSRETTVGGHKVDSFLFTYLSKNAGKILLNTDIGDFGKLTVKPCGCLFGELGMNVHVYEVRSYDKLTCEGMTLLGSQLDDIVGEMIEEAGGCPDDYQFWETYDNMGLAKLIVAVNPKLRGLDQENFSAAILSKLRCKNITITSQFWEQAKTLQLVRAYPQMTKKFKMLPIKQNPQQCP
jgi:hypothetical protein